MKFVEDPNAVSVVEASGALVCIPRAGAKRKSSTNRGRLFLYSVLAVLIFQSIEIPALSEEDYIIYQKNHPHETLEESENAVISRFDR